MPLVIHLRSFLKYFSDLIGKKKNNSLSVDVPKNELPNTFNIFFTDKIEKIRVKLDQIPTQTFFKKYRGLTLNSFAPVTEEYVGKIISKCKKSFSELDPLLAKLFYECLDVLLPCITKIYNDSLASGTFPSYFKDSLGIPLLEKPSLDCNNLKNYRPVSNLSFISKELERIVYFQFLNHITANKLIDKFQSAYKPGHSTETALIRVVNDMLNAIDNGNLSLLTLLDLSAAFDTIDHFILLERLQTSFCIDGLPLKWVKSYLSNKHQRVKIDNNLSNVLPILYGVPQGSVLGPLLFSMYIYPLTDVIDDHKLFYHVNADDTQLYCSSSSDQIDSLLDKTSTSADAINLWMSANKLKINNEKIEILLCGTNAKPKSVRPNSLEIGNNIIDFATKVKKKNPWFVLRK